MDNCDINCCCTNPFPRVEQYICRSSVVRYFNLFATGYTSGPSCLEQPILHFGMPPKESVFCARHSMITPCVEARTALGTTGAHFIWSHQGESKPPLHGQAKIAVLKECVVKCTGIGLEPCGRGCALEGLPAEVSLCAINTPLCVGQQLYF